MITAVDVGATKVLVAQFDSDGRLRDMARFPTPTDQQQFVRELHEHLAVFSDISSIVIGLPGIISDDGILLRCGNLPWRNLAIKSLLEAQYSVPAYAENDTKLAALAEINELPQTPKIGLYLTVSTGIGAGVIVDGKLLPAFRNSEPGHMKLYFHNEWQAWQQFSSGKALVKHFGREAHDFTRELEWQEVADRLSRGLLALIPTLQPEVIIFGGGVGSFFEHFDDLLAQKLAILGPYITLPKMMKAHHPNEAVLYGCYRYATTTLAA